MATSELTSREQEAHDLLVQGYADMNIAAIMGCSYETVKTHLKAVRAKTGCATRLDVVTKYLSGRDTLRSYRVRELRIQLAQRMHDVEALKEAIQLLEMEDS